LKEKKIINSSLKKSCKKLPKTIEKQKWQLHKLKLTHPICLMTSIDGHLILEDEHSCQSKNTAVVRDRPCRYEDRSSQEGEDDGNYPATYITLTMKKKKHWI